MNEENSNLTEQNQGEWQAPPSPENLKTIQEPAQMSEAATLGSIFFEPGRTFEDLRRKPRFILAAAIMIILGTTYIFLFANKVGDAGFRRLAAEQLDKSAQTQSLSSEQKQQSIEISMTANRVTRYFVPLFIIIALALGGLFYWLGSKAMGGSASFLHGVSTWVYSTFPPTIVGSIANFIILFIKPVDEIDVATGQRGLVNANPSFFIDGAQSPVLATLLGTFDFFLIWGWILAAIGLQKLGKISSGSAWAIVLIIALLGITFRIITALFTGIPV
ncbi:MAG: YIP1 family protein [Acidobacteria bacterium]|nr:YIP1 family protein [Acidobacteriota bacterium]